MIHGMTCKELIDVLDGYVEGTMPPAQRREFDAHLAECRPCVAYLKSYRDTVALCGSLRRAGAGPVPPELIEAILKLRRAED